MRSPAAERARALVDDPSAGLPAMTGAEAAALAWALKDEAVAAWGTSPARAVRCAQLIDALQAREVSDEIGAASAWTAGLAALTEGRIAEASARFDAAGTLLLALGRPHEAARTRVNQMITLSILGRHDEACACGEQTLRDFVGLGDEREAGKVELNLGTMLSRRDLHTDAERQFRSAAVRAARAGDRELSIRADIALANALTWQHQFDEARRINERARMRAQTHGHTVLCAHAHEALGRLELIRGDWAAALRELAAACRLLAQSGASPQQRIEAEAALADAYLAVDLLPEARALYGPVIGAATALQAPAELAWALLQSARIDAREGHVAAARQGFERARGLYAEQENAAAVALAQLAIAELDLAAGELPAARTHVASAAAALSGSGIPAWQLDAEVLAARAHEAAGEVTAAVAAFTAARERGAGLVHIELACQHGLGRLAAVRGEPGLARQHLRAALQGIDERRAALPGDLFRHAIGAQSESAHDRLVELAHDEGDAPQHLLELIEDGRARALALAAGESAAAGTSPAAQAARSALQWARARWQQALAEGDTEALPALSAAVTQGEAQWLETLRRDQLAARDGGTGAHGPATAELPTQLAAMGPDQAIVVYHRLGPRLLACVARCEGVHSIEIDARGLDEQLQGLRLQLDTMRMGAARAARHAPQRLQRVQSHLQALHAQVWAPLLPALGACRRIAVVPHRELHYLPFAALHDGGAWLVENHVISLAPGVAWAARALAAPVARLHTALALGFAAGGLAHVEHEAAAVAEAFGTQGQLLAGAQARHAALREAAREVDLLHLACHGQFRADNPMFSSLELADGPINLLDARQLGLRAGLVTLSACETGISRLAPGNEAIGLVRGFLLAGAGGVMASQWAVDDAATTDLMGDFYAALRAGVGAARALAQAQARQARDGKHPFHWAAFALHGLG